MARPATYGPEDFARLEELYNEGLSDQAMERETGMSDSVIIKWRKRNGLESNYVKRLGMPAPYTRANFEGVFDYNAHIQQWFQDVGAETTDEKRLALKIAAKEILETMQGRGT